MTKVPLPVLQAAHKGPHVFAPLVILGSNLEIRKEYPFLLTRQSDNEVNKILKHPLVGYKQIARTNEVSLDDFRYAGMSVSRIPIYSGTLVSMFSKEMRIVKSEHMKEKVVHLERVVRQEISEDAFYDAFVSLDAYILRAYFSSTNYNLGRKKTKEKYELFDERNHDLFDESEGDKIGDEMDQETQRIVSSSPQRSVLYVISENSSLHFTKTKKYIRIEGEEYVRDPLTGTVVTELNSSKINMTYTLDKAFRFVVQRKVFHPSREPINLYYVDKSSIDKIVR